MDINDTLLEETGRYLFDYGCYNIKSFLKQKKEFLPRQRMAIEIIKQIMTQHGKKALLGHIAESARIEHNIKELEPWVRDHVVHALLSFILGIYLNERYIPNSGGTKVDAFQWKLAGLFHDIGYPIQISIDLMKPTADNVNRIKKELGVAAPDILFSVKPINLERLQNRLNSLELIQNRLKEWGLSIDAQGEYEKMLVSGKVCHGMISSLLLLYVIDLMYQKYNPKREYRDICTNEGLNWNQHFFEKDIVSASSAIFIHNLPPGCFAQTRIDRKKAPVAFLLKLSDCLQEWERPSKGNEKGFSSTLFDIKSDDNGKLIFCAKIPENKKDELKAQIMSSLVIVDTEFYIT